MKRFSIKKLTGAFVAAAMIATSFVPQAVLADSQKVVTLGADLSNAQMDTIRRYFGVTDKNVQTIYVTNADEHALLGGSIPREQIGTHAISCAYVQPTASGGIKVKTANLNYVTANMIAAALSTSGVVNCNVIAAAPFEVSGTGALTGVLKAYETAAGVSLSAEKKDTAVKELVTTGRVAERVGRREATKVVNNIKKEIIKKNVTVNNTTEIVNIVNNVVNDIDIDNSVNVNVEPIDPETLEELLELARRIAEGDYDYEDVVDTIDTIDENVNPDHEEETDSDDADLDEDVADPDKAADAAAEDDEPSILDDTDADVFDVDIIEDTTEEPESDEEPAVDPFDAFEGDDSFNWDETTNDQTDSTSWNWDDNGQTDDFNWDTDTDDADDQTGNDDGWDWDFTDNDPDDTTDFDQPDDGEDWNNGDEVDWDDMNPDDLTDGGETQQGDTAADVSFTLDSSYSASFDPFALSFYVSGSYVPVSGELKVVSEDGVQVAVIDLSSSSAYGVLPVSSGDLYGLGWGSANQISVFMNNLYLDEGSYNVYLNAVFEDEAGSRTDTISASDRVDYASSSLALSGSGFKAGSTAALSFNMPDEAAYATVSSSDTMVINPETDTVYAGEGSSVTLYLESAGEAYIYVDFCDESGEVLYSDSIAAAAF